MSNSELCMALMRAETETEVVDVLRDAGYWDDDSVWRDVGDDEGNYSTIGNQQSEAVAALVEKIVNSADARLMDACREMGIDPESPEAPDAVREAVARFFEGVESPDPEKHGRIADWPDRKTTTEAKRLTIAATGRTKSQRPSISIADQGEGQTPDRFPDTFLSLHRGNKQRIRFVQGKFNMGGTGALQFAGVDHNLQLIVARRNPAFLGSGASERDHEWGFTVVRRMPPPAGATNSVFRYLAPVVVDQAPSRGGVLSFAADMWPIFPEADANVRDAYYRDASYGSLIKLYEYNWSGSKSNIVSSGGGLLRLLDVGLPEVALPVRVYECRHAFKGHAGSFATNLLGLTARLEKDRANKLETEKPIGGVIDLRGRRLRVRAFVFRKGEAQDYRLRNGVLFTVNGQTQAHYPVDFFRRKAVGMSYLADSLLVVVDCTDVDGVMRENLFMNSRDRMRGGELATDLERAIEEFLKTDKRLRELKTKRRQEELAEKLQDTKPFSNVLEGLLKQQPLLSKLFLSGINLSTPFPPPGYGEGDQAFKGKPFPTFFRFRGVKEDERLFRTAMSGTRMRLSMETDAEDGYFDRDLDRGTVDVFRILNGARLRVEGFSMRGPEDGGATLTVPVPSDVAVGETFDIDVQVTDPSRIDPFVSDATFTVVKKQESDSGRPSKKRKRGGPQGLTLPNIKPVDGARRSSPGVLTELPHL